MRIGDAGWEPGEDGSLRVVQAAVHFSLAGTFVGWLHRRPVFLTRDEGSRAFEGACLAGPVDAGFWRDERFTSGPCAFGVGQANALVPDRADLAGLHGWIWGEDVLIIPDIQFLDTPCLLDEVLG